MRTKSINLEDIESDEDEVVINKNRRHRDPSEVFFSYMKIAIQVGAIVWGASKISSEVDYLKESTLKLSVSVSSLNEVLTNSRLQLMRLEARLDVLEKVRTR